MTSDGVEFWRAPAAATSSKPLTPEDLERAFEAVRVMPRQPSVEIVHPSMGPKARLALRRLRDKRAWLRVELAVCPWWRPWRRRVLASNLSSVEFLIWVWRRYQWLAPRRYPPAHRCL